MTKMFLGLLASGVLALSTPAFAQEFQPLEGDPESLAFGIISTESTQNLRTQWEPLLEDMSEALGMEIEPFFASDYAGVIEGMRFGKVHVAWYGNKSAMEAVDRANGEIFARTVAKDGTEGYVSHIITSAENKDWNTLEDMLALCGQGHDFGIGDPNSTSGFLVPSYYVFAKNNVDPKECFGTVRNANHETNLMAAANRQVDFATNNSEQITATAANRPEIAEKVKVIWTSPLIPSDPIVYRADLSPEMKSRIAAFFLSYGRLGPDAEAEKQVLAGIGAGLSPFRASTDAQLYPIREIDLYAQMTRLQSDANMDAAEKEKRVAEIEAKLDKLREVTTASF